MECGRGFNHYKLTGKLIMSKNLFTTLRLELNTSFRIKSPYCNEDGLDLFHEGAGRGHRVLRGDIHREVQEQPGFMRLFMWYIKAWVWQKMSFQGGTLKR